MHFIVSYCSRELYTEARLYVNEFTSSVSPKGQITLPQEIRRRLGVKPRDRVTIRLDGDEIKVTPLKSIVDEIAGSVPALDPARPWDEVIAIAREDLARNARDEGRDAE
jgi:AbrB family looped-hinge helix DNA binding protein